MIFLQHQMVNWVFEEYAAVLLDLFLSDVRLLSCQNSAKRNRIYQRHILLLRVFKFDFSRIFIQTFYDFELFGSYLLALGIFVILLYHHKVYTLISVFILSFYELINLIRIIITYSIIIANWDKGDGIIMSNDSDSVTIKALIITCLVCACFGLIVTFSFMNIISDECKFQSRPTPLQQQMTSVTYTNPVAAFPTG